MGGYAQRHAVRGGARDCAVHRRWTGQLSAFRLWLRNQSVRQTQVVICYVHTRVVTLYGLDSVAAMDTRASKRRGGGSAGGDGGGAAAGEGVSAAAVSLGGDGDGSCGGGQTSEGTRAQSPGYGAGYDAGFIAGLLAATQGRAAAPGQLASAEGGAGASAPEPARPPLLALVEDFPDLFQKEVLERLDPLDRALLARTGSGVRTAVKRSGMPRVGGTADGPRVRIVPFCESIPMSIWAVANGCTWQREEDETCEKIATGGNLEVLRWAREHGCPWGVDTCAGAAGGGHLEVLQWAREHGCRWDVMTCACAAESGQMEVLRWAREHDCPWDDETNLLAAFEGQLEVLVWAEERGCPWAEGVCTVAAQGGQLEVLKWLWKQDRPWDEMTCAAAAHGGHLEMLRWAREHGCPWDEATCQFKAGTWRCCSGRGNTTARGSRRRVSTPLRAGTWRFCGGRGSTAAIGIRGRVNAQPPMGA